jgi:diguanylate cyclase (GGDEF)-like protein
MVKTLGNSNQMNKTQRVLLLSFSYLLLFLIIWGDIVTGTEISWSLFYLAPIFLVSWFFGRLAGLLMSVFCAFGCTFSDIYSDLVYSKQIIYFWEFGIKLGIFIIVCLLTNALSVKVRVLEEKEKSLRTLNNNLEIDRTNLKTINKKMLALTEFGEILVVCNNIEELIQVVSSYAAKIIDFDFLALYLFDSSHESLEHVFSAGHAKKNPSNFLPDDCWAIRLGNAQETSTEQKEARCIHVKKMEQSMTYLCLPIQARNELFGLLHVQIENEYFISLPKSKLIIKLFTKTIASAIANINLHNKLYDQSMIDSLTRLHNRRFLDGYIEKQLVYAQRRGSSFALILFDIDDFKSINDTYGHGIGDDILEQLGTLLKHITRAEDELCRYGGEEFMYVLHDCTLSLAKKRSEEIRHQISQMNPGPIPPPITISLGISIYPDDGLTTSELMIAADKALYEAKNTGKNKLVSYSDIR